MDCLETEKRTRVWRRIEYRYDKDEEDEAEKRMSTEKQGNRRSVMRHNQIAAERKVRREFGRGK
jgi:hypothetical protein